MTRTLTPTVAKYIAECRDLYKIKEMNSVLVNRHNEFLPQLSAAQVAELDDCELVESVDGEGGALTLGGVWIDRNGTRHFGPCTREDIERAADPRRNWYTLAEIQSLEAAGVKVRS